MANYLVTGAAGFIASKVIEYLLAEEHSVVGLDNLNSAYDVRLKQWRLDRLLQHPGFRFHVVDICDQSALEAAWNASPVFDAVVNLAARAGVRQSVEDPMPYLQTNVVGTLNLLELCRRTGARKFLLASSSSLYGLHNQLPYSEHDDTSRPLSPYAASKKAAETLCYSYHHLHRLDVTVLRYFTVYGPGGRPDMSAFRFVQWISEGRKVVICGDGRQARDFTYVDDIARGTIAGLKPLGYATINLGGDQPVVLMDIIREIERLVGRQAELEFQPAHPADVRATWADISKAHQLLGWAPSVNWQAGIKRLVGWYMENRAWAREINTI